MTSNVKKISATEVELNVELSSADLKRFVDRAEAEIGRTFQAKGFRKGKVPKDLIKKTVDPKVVLDSALDIALKESLAESIKEKDLDVLNVSNLNIKENSAQKLLYSVALVLFPSISLHDLG